MPVRRAELAVVVSTLVVTACGGTKASGSGGSSSASTGGATNAATTTSGTATGATTASGATTTGSSSSGGLASMYPGDMGIQNDPNVVWTENFEEGSVPAFYARYSDGQQAGFSLDTTDRPAKSSGMASGKLTASGAGPNAVDFYKEFPQGYDELYVRYYAKYEANAPWHHTGVWFGGYNPPTTYPNPQAGLQPAGNDRFSIALEPQEQGATPRMDTYDYWMQMHSWMDVPMGNTAYYGNSVIHDPTLTAKPTWQCFEIHLKVNTDLSSGKGAELGVWVDDQSILQFNDTTPLGYWVKDKFCPENATGTECTMYKPANPTLVPLDQQYRSTAALQLNYFWPQNYITDAGSGTVWYDDMVVAEVRVGCIQ